MKKFFIFALILVLMFTLCACSSGTTVVNGNEVVVKDGESVTIASGDFIVTRIDACATRVRSMYTDYEYIITAKSDTHTVLINVDAEHYAKWDIGTVISGTVTKSWNAMMERFDTKLHYTDYKDHDFTVQWCGEN